MEGVLSGCASTEMVVAKEQNPVAEPTRSTAAPGTDDALRRWDDNRNGRITCQEARRHGIAPAHREHATYQFMRDGDRDVVVWESLLSHKV